MCVCVRVCVCVCTCVCVCVCVYMFILCVSVTALIKQLTPYLNFHSIIIIQTRTQTYIHTQPKTSFAFDDVTSDLKSSLLPILFNAYLSADSCTRMCITSTAIRLFSSVSRLFRKPTEELNISDIIVLMKPLCRAVECIEVSSMHIYNTHTHTHVHVVVVTLFAKP